MFAERIWIEMSEDHIAAVDFYNEDGILRAEALYALATDHEVMDLNRRVRAFNKAQATCMAETSPFWTFYGTRNVWRDNGLPAPRGAFGV